MLGDPLLWSITVLTLCCKLYTYMHIIPSCTVWGGRCTCPVCSLGLWVTATLTCLSRVSSNQASLLCLSKASGILVCLLWLQVLAGLHLEATRVQPVKASLRWAQETHRKHDYDKNADLLDGKTQRELSLTATWERLLQKIALDVDMGDTDFACIFEDDVALHDDLSTTDARKVILHGMDLARNDGVLYLGICEPTCLAETEQWLGSYKFTQCYGYCAHAVAVTKAKAATYMDEMHAAFQNDFKTKNYTTFAHGHVIDQMQRVHAYNTKAIWTIATNLVDPQTGTYGYGPHYGAFIQDKWRHRSIIDPDEALRVSGVVSG